MTTEEHYPLLCGLLHDRSLPFLPFFTTRDVAAIFMVTSRSILYLIAAGKLVPRDLPGRAKFLPQDLEDYLRKSKKGGR